MALITSNCAPSRMSRDRELLDSMLRTLRAGGNVSALFM